MLANVCFPVGGKIKECEANKKWKEDGCRKCSCSSDGKEVVCATCVGGTHCHKEMCVIDGEIGDNGGRP